MAVEYDLRRLEKIDVSIDPAGLATEAKQDNQITNQGTDGAAPPSIPGTGISGWLRSIYDRLANITSLTFTGADLNITGSVNTTTEQITSVDNSTIIPLGIGATFTGDFDINDFSDVMVHVETDQAGTLFFDFSQNGTDVDVFPFSGFAHVANIPSFHIAVKGRQQFRIRFENTSGVGQTFLRIFTYYGSYNKPNTPIGVEINDSTDATVTHSVLTGKDITGTYRNIGSTPSGNLKVTLHDSQTNSRQIVDLNGAAKMGEAIILVGDKFGTVAPSSLQWTTEFVGSGASLSLPGTQRIETSTTANSEARFQSVKAARFMISQFNIFHGGIEIDNRADANCERRFGAFDPINASQNGCYYALIDGAWNVAYCKNGVETLVPQANWNGTNKDLFNADPALSVYEIQYNAGSIFFFQGPNFLHRVSGLLSPYAAIYDFKVSCEVINTGGNTTNNGIDFRALGTYRLGEEKGETISRAFTAASLLVKSGAGYCEHAFLSRTGSGGGSAVFNLYDGVDATGILMKRIDVGADDYKGGAVKSTFSTGLFYEKSGTGTITVDIAYE